MKLAPFLLLFVLLGIEHDEETKRSIAVIEKLKGKAILDMKAPGHPVVEVNL